MAWIAPVVGGIASLIGGNAQNKANIAAQQQAQQQAQQFQQQMLAQAFQQQQQAQNQAFQRLGQYQQQNPNPANSLRPIQGPPDMSSGPMGGGMIGPGGSFTGGQSGGPPQQQGGMQPQQLMQIMQMLQGLGGGQGGQGGIASLLGGMFSPGAGQRSMLPVQRQMPQQGAPPAQPPAQARPGQFMSPLAGLSRVGSNTVSPIPSRQVYL